MGLADVQQKQTTNWKAFLVAVLVGIIGSAGSTILSVYYAQVLPLVVLGLVVSCLCVIIGIYAGLKIQRTDLIKSMKATGTGSSSGKATVIISQQATGTGRTSATARAVPHNPECAAHEKESQALGTTHYEVPMQTGVQCSCSCHER